MNPTLHKRVENSLSTENIITDVSAEPWQPGTSLKTCTWYYRPSCPNVGFYSNIQTQRSLPFLYGDEDCACVGKVTAESVQCSEKAICQIIVIANW